ncbi:MAG: dihydrofolate reductase (trimethoprim resistance protein) [Candidatus Azotimanducaceae bacterium]|jgi:dihydrofolate reductase (trimethoprim resistance protein)
MTVSLVAARALNHVIGNGPNIPWRVKGEQKLFREITLGGILIMGRKTFESIGKPLPGRSTIIVSRDLTYQAQDCQSAGSLEAALTLTNEDLRPVFIVGGGEIYRLALELQLVDTVHLTTIQTNVEGDVIFPEFPTPEFTLVQETIVESNINYVYQYFEKTS